MSTEAEPTSINTEGASAPQFDDVPPIIEPDHTASKEPLFGKRKEKGSAKKKAPKKKVPAAKKGQFVKPLEAVYSTIGTLLLPFDPTCGQVLLDNAHNCAVTLDELAQHNPQVRKVLFALTQSSAWGAVFMAHVPIFMVIARHHVPIVQKSMDNGMAAVIQMTQQDTTSNGNNGESTNADI